MLVIFIKMSQFFFRPYIRFGGNVKLELDFSSYVTKSDRKIKRQVLIHQYLQQKLTTLKLYVDKSDIGILMSAPTDLKNFKNGVVFSNLFLLLNNFLN